MRLVHVSRPARALSAGGGPLVVPHAEARVERELEAGEECVLGDEDGELHAGAVLAVDRSSDHPVYLIRVGVRLPPDLAAQRLAGAHRAPENAGRHEVVDLLGDLARALEGRGQRGAGRGVSGGEPPAR